MMSPNIAKLVVTLLIRLYANLLYFYPIRGKKALWEDGGLIQWYLRS